MADRNTFGLNPLDRAIADFEEDRAVGLGLPQLQRPGQDRSEPADGGTRGVRLPQADDQQQMPAASQPARVPTRGLAPPVPMRNLFEDAARRYDVPVNILMALAHQESGYNPLARGQQTQWGRAEGMMQYLNGTAKTLGINPYDPQQSVNAAAMQIRERLDKGYSMEDAVKEHFAGPNRKLWGQKTAKYGEEVIAKARALADELYPEVPAAPGPQDASVAQSDQDNINAALGTPASQPQTAQPEEESPSLMDDVSDLGKNLKIGANIAAQDFRELATKVLPKSVVDAIDSVDTYFQGKPSAELLKSDTEAMTKSMTPQMQAALRKNWWDDKKGTFGDAWTDWRSYASGIVQSAPEMAVTMAPAMLMARGVYGARIAAGAGQEVAAAAAARAATLTGSIGEGLLGGAQSSREVRDQINALPQATLDRSDAYKSLLSQGMTPEKARSTLADDAASRAFVTAGVATGIFGGMGDRAIAKIVGEKISGNVARRLASGFSRGAIGEGLFEELPQSIFQQVAQNEAMRKANPDQSLTEDVANQAIGGLVTGGLMGGGLGGAGGVMSPRGEADAPRPAASTSRGPDGVLRVDMAGQPQPTGPMARAAQAGEDAARARRVVVQTPDGNLTGFLDGYQQTDNGGFVARVLGDDGQFHQFTDADGVSIRPEQAAAPALPAPTIEVDPTGTARTTEQREQQRVERQQAVERERTRREQLGMTPGTDRAARAQRSRESMPQSLDDGTPVDVVTSDGEVVSGQARNFERVEDGARLELVGEDGAVRALQPDDISEVIPRRGEDGGASVPVRDERAASPEGAEVQRDREQGGSAQDAGVDAQQQPRSADTGEPDADRAAGVSGADQAADAQPALTPERGVADMTLDELVERRKYLSDQAVNNKGWDKRLVREKRKIENAIRKIDPGALRQFQTPAERRRSETKAAKPAPAPQPQAVEAPESAPELPAAPQPSGVTTAAGKPLVEFRDADGEPVYVRQDQYEAGQERLAAFDGNGARRIGTRNNITRANLRPVQVEQPAQAEAAQTDFGTRAEANRAMMRQAEQTGRPHRVVEREGRFAVEPVSETPEPATAAPRRPRVGDPDYSITDARNDLIDLRTQLENQGPVQDDRLRSRVQRQEALVHEMEGESAPAPLAPTAKRPPRRNRKAEAEQQRQQIADYFTPGNIVRSYSGFDRVLSFTPGEDGSFQVRVEAVERDGAGWRTAGDPRTHRTTPSASDLRRGPVERAPVEAKGRSGSGITPTAELLGLRHKSDNSAPSAREQAARALLESTRDELKNAVDIGLLTQAQADDLIEQARKTGDAAAADSLVMDAIDAAEARGKLPSSAAQDGDETAPPAQEQPQPPVSANTIFTEDAAEKARAVLRAKLNQLNTGIDPEIMQAGITLAGYHIERGARTFAAYAQAMVADLGDIVRPYLKSWYMGVKYDPRATGFEGMSSAAEVEAADIDNTEVTNDTEATARNAGTGAEGPSAESAPADEGVGATGDLFGQPDRADVGVDQLGDGRGNGPGRDEESAVQQRRDDRAAGEYGEEGSRGNGVEPSDRADRQPASAARNYRIRPGELTREGSWKATAERNVEIVELVKRLDAEGRVATPEEKALLTKFTGWGASEIANGVFPDRHGRYKAGWEGLGERLKAALTPEEYDQARRTTQYAHYTSEGVIRSIYAGLQRLGFQGGSVLEPGMGIGLFAGLMPDAMAAHSLYTGVEYDGMTGAIAKQLYPESNVIVGDFTKTKLPKNFFDAAIGNPPFSSTVISNDPEYKRHGFMLHDYFFAKTIDRVKPGGMVVFVTSKGTMDKANDRARKYLAERANLIGAVRLPQTAFQANAGTEVVTDVLFLQKRGDGIEDNGVQWLGLKDVKTAQGEATPVNEYFADHPEMVLGDHALTGSMYRANEYTVTPRAGEDIESAFARAVDQLPENIYRPEIGSQGAIAATIEREFNPRHRKEGGLYVSDQQNALMQVENGSGVPVTERIGSAGKPIKLKPAELKWLRGYVGVRDALKQAQYDQLNDGDWQGSLARLNEAYDAFVAEHGPILAYSTIERPNPDGTISETKRFKNKPLWEMDAEGALVHALERIKEDGTIDKGVALRDRVLKRPAEPVIKTTQDAMFVSLNRLGRLDIDDVAKLAGTSRQEAIDALGTAIYEAPGEGWQMADQYLSGNVVRKLEEARAAAETNPRYKRNIDALLAVQPRPLGPTDITVRLGANWVPTSDIGDFTEQALGERMEVMYTPKTGDWSVVSQDRNTASEWGTGKVSPARILDSVLNSRQIKVTEKDADGKTYVDPVETEKANDIARKMKETFSRWIWTDPERADRLTKFYNENFNNIAPRQFDGSHLTLPGVSLRFNLYPHQKRAIWRVIQEGDTYLAHAVGAGKTFTMIAAGMEMKRLGMVDKPVYTVPNHMLAQFAREFLELYPTANIMVADEQNFHTSNRRRFLAQAALNNPDAIIITHSAFSRLGMSDEYADAFIGDQIDEWKSALADVDKSDRITRKQIERRIEQLERRIEGKQAKEKKDRVLTFEELGADYLFVDEMHEFRKLDFATNQGNIKGIDPAGSQRALDLFMKVQYLRSKKPGRSITGASGTPITNTMGELYTVQRIFQPTQLEEDGLSNFDAWAAQYGDTVTALEQNAAGGYETVTRFAKFQNVPELMRRVRSFMDILTSSNLGALVKRPAVEGGGRRVIVTPTPDGYKAYQKELESRIRAIRQRTGPPQPGDDIILNVIADGRFSAIDMRFVDPAMEPDPNSKLNQMLDDLIEAYRQTADNEYTDPASGRLDPNKGSTLMVFSDIGLGDQAAARRGFSMRSWIEKRLADAGIPAEHVAFMRDYKQHAKKERMFADMREGKKRILIGGKDMETGVNVQKRLSDLFHLDAPWFPASVEQREGRIERQGNQNEKVRIRAYATKGSYDSTMWGMNARKARFIEQAMNGDDSVRSLEDVSEASSFEMASALASGDERYLKLAGLRGDVERLSRLRQAHYDDQNRLRRERHWAESEIERKTKQIGELKEAIARRVPILAGEFAGTVEGRSFDARDEFSKAVFDTFKDLVANQTVASRRIGQIGGFDIQFDALGEGKGYMATVHVDLPGSDPLLSFPLDPDMAINGIATRAANQINGLDRRVTMAEQDIDQAKRKIKQIDQRAGAVFPEEADMLEKIAQLNELEAELAAESEAANAEPAEGAQAAEPVKFSVAEQTDTPQFRRWFGDSKVVDSDGKPMVVYHGTDAEFTQFDPAKRGSNTGWSNTNLGFFFVADPALAENFLRDTSGGNRIMGAYLSIQKPLRLTTPQDIFTNKEQAPTLAEIVSGERLSPNEALKRLNEEIDIGNYSDIFEALSTDDARAIMERDGYDGVFAQFGDGNTEYVAFRPEQIKSATGNNGDFDAGNPDIRYSVSPQPRPADAIRDRILDEGRQGSVEADQGNSRPGQLDDGTSYSIAVDGARLRTISRGVGQLAMQQPMVINSTQAERDAPTAELRNRVFKALADGRNRQITNPDIGEIALAHKGISKSRANAADRAKLMTVPQLAQIIEGSTYLGSRPASGKSPGVAGYHYLGRRVTVDGVPLVAITTLEENAQGRVQYYNHTMAADIDGAIPQARSSYVDAGLAAARRPSFHADARVAADPDAVRAQRHDQVRRALVNGVLGGVVDRLMGDGRVILHASQDSLPRSVAPRGGPAIQGYTDRWGRIHLVGENLTPQTARPVLLHEAFHMGAEPLYGTPRWQNLTRQLERFYAAAQQRRAEGRTTRGDFWDEALRRVEAAERAGAVSPDTRMEEFAAYAVENYEAAPSGIRKWIDAIIGAVKAWLSRRFGLQAGAVTPAQLRAMAVAALRVSDGRPAVASDAVGGMALGDGAMSVEDRYFVNEVLAELAQHDEFFRYPKSGKANLKGVFADVDPTVKYVGVEPILENDQADNYGAERMYTLRSGTGSQIRVYEDRDRVWMDISRETEGGGGSGPYAAVANYALNTGRVFIGDPAGLSDVALRRRTEAMLSTALKFGTTQHISPHPRQLAGDAALGVPPLRWQEGNDSYNIREMIDVSLASLAANVPEFRKARYDFAKRAFVSSRGERILEETLERWIQHRRVRASSAGSATLKRAMLLQSIVGSESSERPGLLEQVFRQSAKLVAKGEPLHEIFYSVKPLPDQPAEALRQASAALNESDSFDPSEVSGLEEFSGAAIRDLTSRYMKYAAHPRHIAALYRDFTPVYEVATDQQHARNQMLEDFHQDYRTYEDLPAQSKERVNKVLELGRLASRVYTDAELRGGVTNPGYTYTVSIDAETGQPHRVRQPFQAALTKVGEKITLSPQEVEAYQSLRKMFDNALDQFARQTLRDTGFEQFADAPDPLKALRDSAKTMGEIPGYQQRVKNILQFLGDIEQSKRTGYVPFSRYGDYVIAVKQRQADIRYVRDDVNGGYIVQNLPEDMDQTMEQIGAAWDRNEQAWRVNDEQRRELERRNETTVYSEKVETGLRDKFGPNRESRVKAEQRDVTDIPSVRRAMERIRKEHVDGQPNRRIVSFETTKKRGEGTIDLSALDALAEIAQIDNATWDAVRGELGKALQAGGFRRHFFQSANVPGYTTDFQRSIADYIVGMSGYLARRQHSDVWDRSIRGIKGDKLHEYASKYRQYFNDPREEFSAIRQAAFLWKIGANLSSAVVNLTQTALTTVPMLSQVAGAPVVGMELAKAMRDAVKMVSIKSGVSVFDMDKAPQDLKQDFQRADAEGLFLPLNSFSLMGQANQKSARGRRIAQAADTITNAVSLPFQASERFNRIVAFMAANRVARRKGMQSKIVRQLRGDNLAMTEFGGKNFTPYNFAKWLSDETQFTMGKVNRPVMMRGAGAAMLQFKSFTFQMLEKMYRDATIHGPAGKVAAAATLMMLVAFSGVWGAPGADDLRKLFEFLYKTVTGRQVDTKDELRQLIYGVTNSVTVSDIVSSGVPYHYGVDLSQRVGMGGLLPEQYNKTGVDILDLGAMIGGPGFDMLVTAPVRAAGMLASGNISGAVKDLSPVWVKNVIQGAEYGTDGVRSRAGNKIMGAQELGPLDPWLKGFGFQPSRVSRQYDLNEANYIAQHGADDVKRNLRGGLVRAMQAQASNADPKRNAALQKDVDEAMQRITQFNKTAAPADQIKLTRSALRSMMIREQMGSQANSVLAPKARRGEAASRAAAYGLEK